MEWHEVSKKDLEGDSEWSEIKGKLSIEIIPDEFPSIHGLESKTTCIMDVLIVSPKELPEKITTIVDVCNRGLPLIWNICEDVPLAPGKPFQVGNNYFKNNSICYVACGWQNDLPKSPVLYRMDTPILNKRGSILVEIETSTQHMSIIPGVDKRNLKLPELAAINSNATLYKLDYPKANPILISSEKWNFGKYTSLDSDIYEEDRNFICMNDGFEKGKIYQLVYEIDNARIGGLGLASIAACGKWLKNDVNCPIPSNTCIAVGGSQTGRFLRTFIHDDFNFDKSHNSEIFDGFFICVAGATYGQFNQVYGQPSMAMPHLATKRFPFSPCYSVDNITNEKGSLNDKFNERNSSSKIIFMNTTIEYYRGDASLLHVDVSGKEDLSFSDNIRYYVLGAAPHNPFPSWPPSFADSPVPIGNIQQTLINSINARPFYSNMIIKLKNWIIDNCIPPPNCYPTLKNRTLIKASDAFKEYSLIPGLSVMKNEYYPFVWRRDFKFHETTGICESPFPIDNAIYEGSFLVPKIDKNRNELDVILMPIAQVPLATFTGWALRSEEFGGEGRPMMISGSTIPFSWQKDENDPRDCISELYNSKESYLQLVKEKTQLLIENGFILSSDESTCMSDAQKFWEWLESKQI